MLPSTIIVPLDGSPLAETAVGPGRDLATRFGADLLLVRASWRRPPDDEERYLQGVAADLDSNRVGTRTLHGFAAPEVLAVTEEIPASALCLATRGHSGLVGEVLLGSVATELVSSSCAPIVLVGPSVTGSHLDAPAQGCILFCFDDSHAARQLEPTVVAWASCLGLAVKVVTVLHRDGEFLGGISSESVRMAGFDLVARLEQRGVGGDHLVVDGLDPARAILRVAQEHDAALVVAGTTAARHSQGVARLSRAVLGSTAERLVRHSTAPVLVAQPHGTDG
jgi:nucleotide-binding universal stress UspA family protein